MSVENIRVLCPGIDVDGVAVIHIDHANDNTCTNANRVKSTASFAPCREKDGKQATFLIAVEKGSNDTVTTSPDPPQD